MLTKKEMINRINILFGENSKIAKWIKLVATDFEANKDKITHEVCALCEKYPIYE